MSELTRIIGLLYRMDAEDEKRLADELLEQRKRIWNTALRAEASAYGCNKVPNAPRGEDLRHLKALSRQDAASIVKTWNRDVQRQIEAIYKANPRSNRFAYARQMEAWSAQRDTWKLPQIALNTNVTTTEYARERFRELNLTGDRYIAAGPPPTCDRCISLFAAGVVDLDYTRRNPFPAHINCPHRWEQVRKTKLNCEEIWLG